MQNATLICRQCASHINNIIQGKDEGRMIGCQYCKFASCLIPIKVECPFNRLWELSVVQEEIFSAIQ